jgi:hypothetical protein
MKLTFICLLALHVTTSWSFTPRIAIRGPYFTLRASDSNPSSDDVTKREGDFNALLNSMLGEARDNNSKRDIDVSSAEAMMMALQEAKRLNLTEEEAEEQERLAVEEFSASFMDFVDGMVKIESEDSEKSMADAFGRAAASLTASDDTLLAAAAADLDRPSGTLSMSEALTMIQPLGLNKVDYEETVEMLNEVSPEERFDILQFMVKARMPPILEEEL